MPPKAKITREMVIEAAFQVVRSDGIENVNARTVSNRLHWSTQPVMYHFDTIRELKLAVRKRCLQYHKEYLSKRNTSLPYTDMSMNYIRFGYEEKNIFHFFTEWSKCVESSVVGVLDDVIEANLILGSICEEMGVSMEEARIIFHHTFIIVHGYACLFAYNDLLFDEKTIFNDYQTMIHGICYEIIKK